MGHLLPRVAAWVAGLGALIVSGAAQATCPIPVASSVVGLYGASAVTAVKCFDDLPNDLSGGTLSTTASASTSVTTATLTSSATLASGVLTAYAPEGIASASLWDTLTFSGLPSAGEDIMATLSLAGTLSGSSFLLADLEAGTPADFTAGFPLTQTSYSSTAGPPLPTSISLTFLAQNGVAETVFADILANGVNGVADFADPPNLEIFAPLDVGIVTAGGFDNFGPATAVPEPSTWALMLTGFAALSLAWRRRRSAAA